MRHAIRLLALVLSFGATAPGAFAAGERVAEITGDQVRFRSGAGTRFPVLGKLGKDQLVIVIGSEGRWKKVRIPGGISCFVHGSLVTREKDGTGAIKGNRVLLRASPGKEHAPLEVRLGRGDKVVVLEEAGDWLRVIPPDRTFVYIYDELVRDLGPVAEYRGALARAAEQRRKTLTGDQKERSEKERELAKRRDRRQEVVRIGKEVLAGKGDVTGQEKSLTRIALESDDDLTQGYANALLKLVLLRRDADDLATALAKAEKEHAEETESLRAQAAEARKRYEEALKKAEILKTRRENPFRGVGVVTKREEGWALMEKGRVVYYLDSKRFRLADYAGKRVGVNGRLIVTDVDAGRTTLMVEKLEILPGKATPRKGR